METSTTENFVPQLNSVLNSTETLTLEATNALMNKGINDEVQKFQADVRQKIAETRARLNKVKNVTGTPPAPGQGGPPALVTPRRHFSSPKYKLNLLKVLNESLINTIKQVIEQMGTANTDFIRRALGYIQLLLIQLQNLVVIFNRLDKRMGNIEKRLKIHNNIPVNSQPDLQALRKQLEEVMRLAPTAPAPAPAPAPARTGWFGFFGRKGGYSRKLSKTKRKTPAKTRKRAGHKKASRKNRES